MNVLYRDKGYGLTRDPSILPTSGDDGHPRVPHHPPARVHGTTPPDVAFYTAVYGHQGGLEASLLPPDSTPASGGIPGSPVSPWSSSSDDVVRHHPPEAEPGRSPPSEPVSPCSATSTPLLTSLRSPCCSCSCWHQYSSMAPATCPAKNQARWKNTFPSGDIITTGLAPMPYEHHTG